MPNAKFFVPKQKVAREGQKQNSQQTLNIFTTADQSTRLGPNVTSSKSYTSPMTSQFKSSPTMDNDTCMKPMVELTDNVERQLDF